MSRRDRSAGLLWEKVYPYLLGLCAGGIWLYCGIQMPTGNFSNLMAAALTLGAILTGFLATSKTILFGMKTSKFMRQLQRAGFNAVLMSYLAQGIWVSFAFSLICLAGFFVAPQFINLFGTLWIAVGVMSGLAFYRVTQIILLLLKREDDQEEPEPPRFICNFPKSDDDPK